MSDNTENRTIFDDCPHSVGHYSGKGAKVIARLWEICILYHKMGMANTSKQSPTAFCTFMNSGRAFTPPNATRYKLQTCHSNQRCQLRRQPSKYQNPDFIVVELAFFITHQGLSYLISTYSSLYHRAISRIPYPISHPPLFTWGPATAC